MGYTHYWRRIPEVEFATFRNILIDLHKIRTALHEHGVPLAGGFGTGEPEFTEDRIWFNGDEHCGHKQFDLGVAWPSSNAGGITEQPEVAGTWFAGAKLSSRACGGDCSHETFHFPRVRALEDWDRLDPEDRGLIFDFCKTAYKPYDLAVTAALIVLKHHLKDQILVSSDGDGAQWFDAAMLCHVTLEYGLDFSLDNSG